VRDTNNLGLGPTRVTGADQASRAIRACQRAGLPVISGYECSCRLRGRLVVLAHPGRLEIVWPYCHPCPIHDQASRHARRRGKLAASSQAYSDRVDPIGGSEPESRRRGVGEAPGRTGIRSDASSSLKEGKTAIVGIGAATAAPEAALVGGAGQRVRLGDGSGVEPGEGQRGPQLDLRVGEVVGGQADGERAP